MVLSSTDGDEDEVPRDSENPQNEDVWDDNSASDDDWDRDGRAKNPRPRKRGKHWSDVLEVSARALPPTDSAEHLHNMNNSRLHQLPIELMLEIADYISRDAASILCMQLVARDFYPLFQTPFIMEPHERRAFKSALRRDDLNWFSRSERLESFLLSTKAFCSACGASHLKAQFDEQELVKDAGARTCVGAKETVNLHSWKEVKLNDLYENDTLVPEICKFRRTAALYVSKSLLTGSPQSQSQSLPMLETIVAHNTAIGDLFVLLHFSAPARHCEADCGIADPIETPTIQKFLCWQLQARLQGKKFQNEETGQHKHGKKMTIRGGDYQSLGYQFGYCICRSDTCMPTRYYESFGKGRSKHGEQMMLCVWKIYRAETHNLGPGWQERVVRELAHSQVEMNARADESRGIRLYQVKDKANWKWEDMGVNDL